MFEGEPATGLSGVNTSAVETSAAQNRDTKTNSLRKTILIMSGGEGYVDFRLG